MKWSGPIKPQKIYIDLITNWLRTEIEKLNNILATIERTDDYHDDYILETIKSATVVLRQIRKFLEAN